MSHQTGIANTTQDFLGKLATFAVALGWTALVSTPGFVQGATVNNTGRLILENPAGDSFWEFVGYDNGAGKCDIAIIPSTGYNPAALVASQPGNCYAQALNGGNIGYSQSINYMAYPFTSYQMFGTNQYLHFVIEHQPGKFRHVHLGTLNKRCTFTGGQYSAVTHLDTNSPVYWTQPFNSYNGGMPWDAGNNGYQYGVYSATQVRADLDGFAPGWYACTNNGTTNLNRVLTEYAGDDDLALLLGVQPNTYNQLSCGIPLMVEVTRTGTTTTYSPLGEPADLRVMKYGNYAPGQIETIGSDQWVMFPSIGIAGAGATESDPGIGYMYRIVP